MQGNIKLTARRALAIQASQLEHHSEAIRAKIAEQTNVEGLDLDEELPVHIINRHVPRGGAIEVLAYAEKTIAIPEVIEAAEDINTLQDVLEMRRDRLQENQANKEEAYERLAAKHTKESDLRYQAARQTGSMIPFGQPILVGHYSEVRHRADLKRIDNNMRKSIEHDKTAAYYQDKLATMQDNTAISSDDPDALEKLNAKLQGMEECQEYMKQVNSYIRKVLKLAEDERVEALASMANVSNDQASTWLYPRWGGAGFAGFSLTNNNANIKRIKKRIIEIEAQHKAIVEHGDSVDTEYKDLGLKVVMNLAINRLQFVFDGKPVESVRSELKSNGFRWSPREGAWQRQLNANSKYLVGRMVKSLQAMKDAG